MIELNNLTKSYGSKAAVDGLSLKIEAGEIYGFIGPNGAGKTTTIRMMLNLIKPDTGQVVINGLRMPNDEIAIRRMLGYVPSENYLYADMRVKDLFRFAASYFKDVDSNRLKLLTDRFEIDLHKRFEELSLGNKKKVSIVLSLLHRPSVLIMDEPSNGLDPIMKKTLYEVLTEEQQRGATVFFSSHVLSEVQKFCHRIGMIKDGRLIRESSVHDFIDIGYRNVKLECDGEIDFSRLDGVSHLSVQGRHIEFVFAGKADELMKALASTSIQSISIEEPDPESVFMYYFNQKGEL